MGLKSASIRTKCRGSASKTPITEAFASTRAAYISNTMQVTWPTYACTRRLAPPIRWLTFIWHVTRSQCDDLEKYGGHEYDHYCIDFQGNYLKELIELTDYPTFSVDGVKELFNEWEHHKHGEGGGIMTFRDNSYTSVITGNRSPRLTDKVCVFERSCANKVSVFGAFNPPPVPLTFKRHHTPRRETSCCGRMRWLRPSNRSVSGTRTRATCGSSK